jgi:hypothetical protein
LATLYLSFGRGVRDLMKVRAMLLSRTCQWKADWSFGVEWHFPRCGAVLRG